MSTSPAKTGNDKRQVPQPPPPTQKDSNAGKNGRKTTQEKRMSAVSAPPEPKSIKLDANESKTVSESVTDYLVTK